MKEGKAHWQDQEPGGWKKEEGNSHPNEKEANSPKLSKILNQISFVNFRTLLSLHSSFPVFVSFSTPGWNIVLRNPNPPQTNLPTTMEL